MALLMPTAQGYSYYVQRIPNADNVDGFTAIGHTSDNGDDPPNAFGNAFKKAGAKWTTELCQADTDGDGQTNGQELGDPCCVWTQSSGDAPRWTTGVSHPSDAALTSDPSLWANINCNADTAASSASTATNSTTIATNSTTTTTTNTTTGTGTSGVGSFKAAQSLASAIALATSIALYFA
ncbi:atp-binding cassette superfamily [Phytophthora cinnamomi]|uniref:atp-binding cassette superfamily n=1 Tax=Phytophthora cinnamomi TaxID=4785 RepID=UPI003559E1AC|nr:atp-binding cassette superfamily [Phytophthora cinnamomi]